MPDKTKKKTAVKKSAHRIDEVKESKIKFSSSKKLLTKRNWIVILVIIIAGVLIYFFKGLFVVAIVNGQPITRLQLIQQMEKQAGKATLESLITKSLILQEMKKKNVSVTKDEINSEVKKIEDTLKAQGRTLDDALAQQGIKRSDLAEQVEIQKMVEKLFTKESAVKESEIDKYIEENKDAIPQGEDEKSLRNTVKEQLRQQKLSSEFQKWLTNIKNKAQINFFVNF
jgi:foldase protein PrsA